MTIQVRNFATPGITRLLHDVQNRCINCTHHKDMDSKYLVECHCPERLQYFKKSVLIMRKDDKCKEIKIIRTTNNGK